MRPNCQQTEERFWRKRRFELVIASKSEFSFLLLIAVHLLRMEGSQIHSALQSVNQEVHLGFSCIIL